MGRVRLRRWTGNPTSDGDLAVTCSPERLAANRANALKSTGPKTPEGKAISRRNGLKHGLTGEGVALPDEDAAEVERRFAAMEAEMAPRTELGRALALRAAMLTVRLERCYRNEAARLTVAVDAAPKAYDDGRLAAIEGLMDGLQEDPVTNARRLQQTPEGVAYTIKVWEYLKLDLMDPDRKLWTAGHLERAENLMGRRPHDLPRSRIGALSRAMWYDFSGFEPGEASDLNEQGKYEHARARLGAIIDGRIATLSAVLSGGHFDKEAAGRARAASADLALFEDSREAILARKYEASTERSLFRTLREFREVEESARAAAAEPGPAVITPASTEACEELGSSSPASVAGEVADPPSGPPIEIPAVPGRIEGLEPRDRATEGVRSGPG